MCRCLALLEKLAAATKEDLRLGLVSVTMVCQLTQLPAGNQTELLAAARRDVLTATEVRDLVELLHAAAPEQAPLVLDRPREACFWPHVKPLLTLEASFTQVTDPSPLQAEALRLLGLWPEPGRRVVP